MEDTEHKEQLKIPNQIDSPKNFKNFIVFRKDYKDNKENSSYCFVETDNKIVSFDVKDEKDFFNKSNLEHNIKAIKKEINSRIKSAKQTTNKNLTNNLSIFNKKNEKEIIPSTSKSDKKIFHLKITNMVFESEENYNNNIKKTEDNLIINDNDGMSTTKKLKKSLDNDFKNILVVKKETIKSNKSSSNKVNGVLNKDYLNEIHIEDKNNHIEVFDDRENKIVNKDSAPCEFSENNGNNNTKINFESIPYKGKIDFIKDIPRLEIKNKTTTEISHDNKLNLLKDYNNSKTLNHNYNNNKKQIKNKENNEEVFSSNGESEKYIYESVHENDKTKHEKTNSETTKLIFLKDETKNKKSNLDSNNLINENLDNQDEEEEFKIMYQINDENNDVKINNFPNEKIKQRTISNNFKEKNLNKDKQKDNNIIKFNTEEEEEKKQEINFEQKGLVNKSITIINNKVNNNNNKLNLSKEGIEENKNSNPILNRNYKSTPKIHFNIKSTINKPHNIKSNYNIDRTENSKNNNINQKENYQNESNVTIEENSIIYPFQFCYICDNLNQIEYIHKTENCSHGFCFKCLKSFLESKIDQGDYSIKCPIYTCNCKFKEELVKFIVSEYHFKIYSKKNLINIINFFSVKSEIEKSNKETAKNIFGEVDHNKNACPEENNVHNCVNNENKSSNIIKLDSRNINNNNNNENQDLNINENNKIIMRNYNSNNENEIPTANLNSNVKNYSKKNIVEVDNLNNFYNFNKNREIYCKNCNEPALFIRPGKSSVKCLNCFSSSCKFCLKPITYDHFDLNSFNYCKVYFRRKLKNMSYKNNNLNKFKNFILSFLMILASYFLLFMNCFAFLSKILKKIISIDKYGEKINYFYFINKHNFKKYEYITCFTDEKKATVIEDLNNFKNKNINKTNYDNNNNGNENDKQRRKSINLENNVIIKITKQENYNNQNDGQYTARSREDRTIIKPSEMRCSLAFERDVNHYHNQNCQNINSKFAIENLNLKDKNLINYIKTKLENGNSISRFRLRKITSNPDNRGFFYFESLQKIHFSNIFKRKNKNDGYENLVKNFSNMNYSNKIKEIWLFKFIKYFFYFVCYLFFGLLLLVGLLMIIPFFPLLILIFQL